jgi:hypothetical protein
VTTHILSIARPPLGRRTLIALGSALAVTAFVYAGLQGAPNYDALAANREVEMHVARLPVENLAELAKKSDGAVVGRVVGKGATRFIQASGGTPRAFEPGAAPSGLSAEKAAELNGGPAAPARSRDNIVSSPNGIPITQFTLQVTRSLSGNLKAGEQITLEQEGGEVVIPLGAGLPDVHRTVVAEHDPLLVIGQEGVFFLSKGNNGSFRVTGGPDGRFLLDGKKTLKPVEEGSLVGQANKGLTVDDLQTKLNAVRAGKEQ